jgi:hypothetical protein
MSNYATLAAINVSDKTEKKGNLTYLSWAWAVDQLLRHDPMATWEYKEPTYFAETLMVYCAVTAFGKTMQAQLPVMNHQNKAIANPDAFAVNTAMQRCLAKAIALHGLGLYIYAGEDLPPMDTEPLDKFAADLVQLHNEKQDMEAVRLWYDNKAVQGSNEAREYLWSQLRDYSALRAAIKANKPEKVAA